MSDTFELADEPSDDLPDEPFDELADESDGDPKEPNSKREPVQPLRRLWREEPDSIEDDAPAPQKSLKEGASEPPKKSTRSKASASPGKASPAKAKGAVPADDKTGKKVLIEETPTLDTYETRRRARLIMGSLSVVCILLFVWIIYSIFLSDPVPIAQTTSADVTGAPSGPEPRSSLDQEARFMFNRAAEFAKSGRIDQAVAMLNQVVKVYKGTATAKDAKAALDRGDNNLPLFSDRPLVVARPEEVKSAPAPARPTAVVNATPDLPQAAQGEVALVFPANPSEVMTAPPAVAGPSAAAKAAINSRLLPAGFQANLDAGLHESGWPLVIVGDRDGSPMVLVPGGTFRMGSNEGQPAEAPEHQVRLATYYVDQHEVTRRQFRLFLAEAHYHGSPPGKWLTDEKTRTEPENEPMIQVNFQDAEAFATWAGKLLPTEAQWEMAARSTDGRRYPWGDDSPKWSRARSSHQIDPVMTFPEDKSAYGAYDLAGNVREWTRDWYDYRYYHQFTKVTADNPVGPAPAARSRTPQRVVRGGSKNWSVTYREGVPPDRRLPALGFRCVLMVEQPGPMPASTGPAVANPAGVPPPPGTLPKKLPPPPF